MRSDLYGQHPVGFCRQFLSESAMFCKAKRQYMLTCKVSRYCLFALHSKPAPSPQIHQILRSSFGIHFLVNPHITLIKLRPREALGKHDMLFKTGKRNNSNFINIAPSGHGIVFTFQNPHFIRVNVHQPGKHDTLRHCLFTAGTTLQTDRNFVNGAVWV